MIAAHTEALLDVRRGALELAERMQSIEDAARMQGQFGPLMLARAIKCDFEQAAESLARLIAATGGEGQGDG